jgi:hypothetical protein
MKLSRYAILIVLTAAAALVAAPARAQVKTGAPITVKAKAVKPPKDKIETFKGEVIHMDGTSIVVRDRKNTFVVRTFTYSPKLAQKLQRLINRGGYSYGDKVAIKYKEGSTVAESIKGKASKQS